MKGHFLHGAMCSLCAAIVVSFAGCSGGTVRLLDLNGEWIEFLPDERAAATVCIFARTDCPISNRYAPEIRRLYDAYHGQGVQFCLIYVDPSQESGEIRTHLQEYSYPCRAYCDPNHDLVQLTGATVTPEAVLFDRKRRLVYRGRIDDMYVDFGKSRSVPTRHDLADAIQAVLDGTKIVEAETKAVGCYIGDLREVQN